MRLLAVCLFGVLIAQISVVQCDEVDPNSWWLWFFGDDDRIKVDYSASKSESNDDSRSDFSYSAPIDFSYYDYQSDEPYDKTSSEESTSSSSSSSSSSSEYSSEEVKPVGDSSESQDGRVVSDEGVNFIAVDRTGVDPIDAYNVRQEMSVDNSVTDEIPQNDAGDVSQTTNFVDPADVSQTTNFVEPTDASRTSIYVEPTDVSQTSNNVEPTTDGSQTSVIEPIDASQSTSEQKDESQKSASVVTTNVADDSITNAITSDVMEKSASNDDTNSVLGADDLSDPWEREFWKRFITALMDPDDSDGIVLVPQPDGREISNSTSEESGKFIT